VHLRLCAPELKWPCYFGIDIPTRKELISNRLKPDDIANIVYWVANQPAHVNINCVEVMPTCQAFGTLAIHRNP